MEEEGTLAHLPIHRYILYLCLFIFSVYPFSLFIHSCYLSFLSVYLLFPLYILYISLEILAACTDPSSLSILYLCFSILAVYPFSLSIYSLCKSFPFYLYIIFFFLSISVSLFSLFKVSVCILLATVALLFDEIHM